MEQASCRAERAWWPLDCSGAEGHATPQVLSRARKVCAGCPVLRQCQVHALTTPEPYGLWGALTPMQRGRIRSRLGVSGLAELREST